MPLLDVRNLTIELDTPHGKVRALEKVSLTLNAGEIHGLVGESGSGRSLLARAILGIPGPNWTITADRMMWDGNNLMAMTSKERRNLMGSDMAMIFQDPSGSLDPSQTVGSQLMQAMPKNPKAYFWQKHKHAKLTAQKWLHKVGIKNPQKVMSSYAWELSEGECQKVMIAMAIANQPRLLIADEPTNSMELSTQAQIFRLLSQLNQLQNVSILIISHELETLAQWCDHLSVLYCGQVMESGPTDELINQPYHPYTKALLDNMPDYSGIEAHKAIMPTLPGSAPALQHLPIGCRLGPRCPEAQKKCVNQPSLSHSRDRYFACHFPYHGETTNDDSTA
ncbi:oligopeptide/dipeptide ABC transporter ATP-binding protein [Shewanella xiamenensis]|jgi:cationic peptide transport system ATP-binding protein|uniref:ATP-binding cassette domain-containing protein n=1 Tax=Shewanella xiamenensis TaxID=332186 RepID=A0A073KQF6_9GAMM|nr:MULTISPECIES: oligopeptide/dipeptide ABC transporter ATP-binding protein [Shewanella]PZP34809.1 MAG: peptide ABC transporter ATP-binding protein [Shewanella oneidensis]ASF14810.1 peptide ABC transporter ATP-binding protein [Shewanella sp. FDAARGOS_354]KEK28721.1 peptide ABC transporter ATP-binding protein [Shewanella xiamenensis]KPN78716.1 peptide ABC transporter ATP-binding protein [Shewanella sp. Sh95]MBW0281010.1 peptide ABC transporter ATP-binding protein [Shewanella xiamenensis]